MKFVEVKEIPKVERKTKLRVRLFLDEFMTSNNKFAKIELKEGEYKRPEYAYKTLWFTVKRDGYPIQVITRKNEVYLIRKDM